MKKALKIVVSLALVVALCASFAGCAKLNYVTNGTIKAINEVKSGEWNQAPAEEEGSKEDVSVLKASFEPVTAGGVEFKTLEDVANYYVEAYNYTKTLTANYKENGEDRTYYKLLGEEDLKVGEVFIDGSANATINKLVPGIVGPMFKPNTYGLVPCSNRNPDLDNNQENIDKGEKLEYHDFRTSFFKAEYLLDANVKDNGDGTITLVMQPKQQELAMRGEGPQGSFFEVLGDISGTVASISIIKFEQGTANENVIVNYKGGQASVTIDTATKEVVAADYDMEVEVSVNHATVTVIRDKSAKLTISYKNHYPASDEYLLEKKNIVRA